MIGDYLETIDIRGLTGLDIDEVLELITGRTVLYDDRNTLVHILDYGTTDYGNGVFGSFVDLQARCHVHESEKSGIERFYPDSIESLIGSGCDLINQYREMHPYCPAENAD